MVKFGKGFTATIRSLMTEEDAAVFKSQAEWVRPVTPMPAYFKKDVREMTDAEIEEFAQWAQDAGQSVGVGLEATPEKMDAFMESFQCGRCGKCCRGPLLDGIEVSPSDVKRISRYLKISPDAFMNKYVATKRGYRYGVIAYPCPFLKENSCSIYPIRPIACRTFPIDFHMVSGTQELGVQAFCPAAKDWFIWSAKTRRDMFKGK